MRILVTRRWLSSWSKQIWWLAHQRYKTICPQWFFITGFNVLKNKITYEDYLKFTGKDKLVCKIK